MYCTLRAGLLTSRQLDKYSHKNIRLVRQLFFYVTIDEILRAPNPSNGRVMDFPALKSLSSSAI
jgi:hypothetical protein